MKLLLPALMAQLLNGSMAQCCVDNDLLVETIPKVCLQP